MMKRILQNVSLMLVVALLCGPLHAANENSLDKARSIAGITNRCHIVNIKTDEWNPLNEQDRTYSGPLASGGWGGLAESSCRESVCNQEQLFSLAQGMNYTLERSSRVELRGCSLQDVEKWLKFINTSIFGKFRAEQRGEELLLYASYPAVSRIFAAFRNEALEPRLSTREKQVLQVCADWICGNVQSKMPRGLRLKKVHDALVDNSAYTKGFHDAADIIVSGKGVCSAYASATQLLLCMLGIDCREVVGSAEMNHVWNMVRLGDSWYHLDTTWNDPVCAPPCRMYDYYLLTDAEMDADHDWKTPEIYPRTPVLNAWHFHKRNDLRRSWAANVGGYTLPREDEQVPEGVAERVAGDAANLGDKAALVVGLETDAGEKVKPLLHADAKSKASIPNSKNKAPKVKLRSRKKRLKSALCSGSADIDKALESRLNELDESELKLECGAGTASWRMRKMVAESSLPLFAEAFSAVYDESAGSITLNFKFWSHRRILAAARNDALVPELTNAEEEALELCRQWASTYGTVWKNNRQKLRDAHLALIAAFRWTDGSYDLVDRVDRKECSSRGYAQAMYIVCQLMDLPCEIVNGRTAESVQVWNLVRVDRRKWYHLDAAMDDQMGCQSEFQCKNFLRTDEEMLSTHAWDFSEFPPTPKKR